MVPRPVGLSSVVVPAAGAMLLGAWLDGPSLWLLAALLVLATAVAAIASLASADRLGLGVPVESTLLPSVAAVAGLGMVHFAGVTPGALAALLVAAPVMVASLAAERVLLADVDADARVVRAGAEARTSPAATAIGRQRQRTSAEWQLLAVAVLVAFVGFLGALGLADRAFTPRLPGAGDPQFPGSAQLLVVIVGCSLVAAAIGYRISAADRPELGDALWGAVGYGLLAASGVLVLRAADLPVLSWPGLLTALVYLWGAYHQLLDPADRIARRLLDVLIVSAATVLSVAWHLRG